MVGLTGATITASDYTVFADADDSNALKIDTVQGILDLAPALNVKVGVVSRDVSTASGAGAETVVGFQPKAVIFFTTNASSGNKEFSVGIDDGTTSACVFHNYTSATGEYLDDQTASIYFKSSAGTHKGAISSLGSNGFTITWTKTSSPTGNINVPYLAIG
jgi:hypothetical protein